MKYCLEIGVDLDVSTAIYCSYQCTVSDIMVDGDWYILILILVVSAWRILILVVQTILCCSPRGLLWHPSAVVMFDCRHLSIWNFNSVTLVDVVRVMSYVNGFFNPMGVPGWVAVYKLNLVPERIVSGLFIMFWNCRDLSINIYFIQVRHMFAQCITAMAHHRYLELEGGHKLVEFIVRQCAIIEEEVGGNLHFYHLKCI